MYKITQLFPQIQVIAVANNGHEGIEKLMKMRPKLVFLDIEMNDMTGFEMLLQLPEIFFKTIFITSHRHYAIKAIRFNALDYLLKPIDLDELKNAIARFIGQEKQSSLTDHIHHGVVNFSTLDPKEHVLTLNIHEGQLKIAIKDILHIQGDRNYSQIHLTNKKKEIVSKTLSDLTTILDGHYFFRCHKSYLVNRLHVKTPVNSLSLMVSSGMTLPISRRRKQAFEEWFSKKTSP
jgi:two-component system, LytTR family, response regulator